MLRSSSFNSLTRTPILPPERLIQCLPLFANDGHKNPLGTHCSGYVTYCENTLCLFFQLYYHFFDLPLLSLISLSEDSSVFLSESFSRYGSSTSMNSSIMLSPTNSTRLCPSSNPCSVIVPPTVTVGVLKPASGSSSLSVLLISDLCPSICSVIVPT